MLNDTRTAAVARPALSIEAVKLALAKAAPPEARIVMWVDAYFSGLGRDGRQLWAALGVVRRSIRAEGRVTPASASRVSRQRLGKPATLRDHVIACHPGSPKPQTIQLRPQSHVCDERQQGACQSSTSSPLTVLLQHTEPFKPRASRSAPRQIQAGAAEAVSHRRANEIHPTHEETP